MKRYFLFLALPLLGMGCTVGTSDVTYTDIETDESTEVTEQIRDAQVFEYSLLSDWDNAYQATRSIRELTPNQIIAFGIIDSPYEEHISYFAANAVTDQDSILASVYRYDNSNYNFERIYREEFEKGEQAYTTSTDPAALEEFHVIGIDGEKLIVLVTQKDKQLDQCESALVYASTFQIEDDQGQLISMELDDPYGTVEKYHPSGSILQIGWDWQEECESLLDR